MKNWRVKTEHELNDKDGVITTYYYPQKRNFFSWEKIYNPYYGEHTYYRYLSESEAMKFIRAREELKKRKIKYTYYQE